MKRTIFSLDDETLNLLADEENKSETVRIALKLYKSDITQATLTGIRDGYSAVAKSLKDLHSKVDYLAKRLEKL